MNDAPNILMIFTDQQRWDTMAAYGNTQIHTPNLNRLADQGVVFETAITPCPLCMPARASVVTGLSASKLGCMENSYPRNVDNENAIPAILRSHGYHCQAIGKMHFSDEPYKETYGMTDMILSEETRGVRKASNKKEIVLDDYDQFLAKQSLWGWDKPLEIGYNEIKPLISPLPRESHVTQWCGDQTVHWLKHNRPKDKPFFLWSSFVKPHVPYDCPQHLVDLYNPSELEEPWMSNEDGCDRNPYLSSYASANEFDLYSDEAKKRAKAFYYANITFIDEQIGRILNTLEEEGLLESTLIIFSSDHGDLMGDHGLWYKCFGFEGSVRVPLIMSWPKVLESGRTYNGIVSLLDLFPTILSAANINNSNTDYYGKDLCMLLDGQDKHEVVFSEVMNPPYTMLHVRTRQYKYLYYQNGGYEQLFDIVNDPRELIDLAQHPSFEDIRLSLKELAIQYLTQYGDPTIHLDDKGKLRQEAYQEPSISKQRPFSRMPWDARFGPGGETLFYDNREKDWLSVLF